MRWLCFLPHRWGRRDHPSRQNKRERKRTRVREDRSRHAGKQRGKVENVALNWAFNIHGYFSFLLQRCIRCLEGSVLSAEYQTQSSLLVFTPSLRDHHLKPSWTESGLILLIQDVFSFFSRLVFNGSLGFISDLCCGSPLFTHGSN